MSAGRRLQLVQLFALAGAGLVRVTWSPVWSCYLVTVTRPGRGIVAEHQVRDRARALGLADQALAELADAAGVPA
jgi:hypothetical protein